MKTREELKTISKKLNTCEMEKYDIMINVEKIKVEMEWRWNKKVGLYTHFLISTTSVSSANLRFGEKLSTTSNLTLLSYSISYNPLLKVRCF